MCTAQISFMPLFRRLDRIATEWPRLIDRTLDGYRPERHYMRGPGPNGTPSITPERPSASHRSMVS